MIIVKNKIIPFKGMVATTIFPFVFCRRDLTDVEKNHEGIHLAQELEVMVCSLLVIAAVVIVSHLSAWWLLLSLVMFYLWYFVEYVVRLIICRDSHKAYRSIAFEQEAYLNEQDLLYLPKHRKAFAWVKYIV